MVLFPVSFCCFLLSYRPQERYLKPMDISSGANDPVLNEYFKDATSVKTIIGFGSLMSKRSASLTFPNLTNFRVVRVPGMLRVFRQPASVFFERGIADLERKMVCSLSTEENAEAGFLGVAFDVSDVSPHDFLRREEEFDFKIAEFIEKDSGLTGCGLLCTSSSDNAFIHRWGNEVFTSRYLNYGVPTIWGFNEISGLKPCSVYMRHCYLAAQNLSPDVLASFLDETVLIDRTTTAREYLEANPWVLETAPPQSLVGRYSG